MNLIVAATDFSPSADNAALYAAQLAVQTGAKLLLVHVYQVPVTLTAEVPVMLVPVEELRQQADASLMRTRELIEKNAGITPEVESRMGSVTDELDSVCTERHPSLVVVGKHGGSGVEKVLFGNTTLSVIKQSKLPVLAVPGHISAGRVANAAFAVDLNEYAPETLQRIEAIVKAMGCRLHIIHVNDTNDHVTPSALQHLLPHTAAEHQVIRSDNFTKAIQEYIRRNGIDLLIVAPHRHNLMERLFFRTHTVELVDDIDIPLLAIRD